MTTIYIISGPAGVGKSTMAKRLAGQFAHSAYIEGDFINHLVVGGYVPPWESEEQLSLTWENIADLSINFVRASKNVVIDYVAFPEEVDAEVVYVVLWVEREELLRRDALREADYQMGARCLELADEFESKRIEPRFLYDTMNVQLMDLDEILLNIRKNSRFTY